MDFSTVDALFNFVIKSRVMRESKEIVDDTLFKSIVSDLACLKVIVIAPPQQLVEDGTLQVLQSIAISAESIISSFDLNYMGREMAFELETQLFELLMPMKDWKKEAARTYDERPKPSRFYHPRTRSLLYIESLEENLEDMMKMKGDLLGPLSHFISLFRQKLQYLSTERRTEVYLMESVTHLSYEAEYAIDSFLVKDVPLWYSVHSLVHILLEFELSCLMERESTIDTSNDDDIVGFKEEMKSMLYELTRGSETFSIVSVVGMAGQGKTTLATKMYKDAPIVDHFDFRAKCIVSQTYEKRDLLLQLLEDTVHNTWKLQQETDYHLGVLLKRSLLGRKFLIYMDDIWKIDAWKELSEFVPKPNNGSRVMFTMRSTDLALEVKSDSIFQDINPLSDDEGLELIRKKVFPKEAFPRELLSLGKQIAKSCKGLPLSLVLAADNLSKLEIKYDKRKQIADQITSNSPKQSQFYNQRTTPLVFIEHLLENLEEVVQDMDCSISIHCILRLQYELKFWKGRLIEIAEQPNEPLHLKHLMRRITNLAYEVEYAIDSFLVGDFPIWHSNWLLRILFELEQVEMKARYDHDNVVGFKAVTNKLLELLTSFDGQVISIVGGPGLGKTSLTKNLYNHTIVVDHFEVRVWCTVSQEYKKREVILQLLGQLIDLSDTTLQERSDHELGNMLRESLLAKKYLLVLDDIWSINVWIDLAEYLPNDQEMGIKILMTTTMRDLAKEIKLSIITQPLSLLSNDESWELLGEKLFYEDGCPEELLEVGKEIARNCNGLPLSIISTARILQKSEKTAERWKEIAANLTSHILADAKGESKAALDSSYSFLPDYLKQCFMYFVVALNGKEISVSKLIRFWIAEGFIENPEFGSLEDKAYIYLKDLIDRSLVTVNKLTYNGFPKSCHLERLLHEYCSIKSKEDKFFHLINGYDKFFPFSNITLDYGINPNSSSSTPTIYYNRRLSIFSKRNHLIMLKPSGPFAHSLLFSAISDMCPSYSYNISFLLTNFKILRILDFEDINIGDSFKIIDKLVLLKYLAVQSSMNSIPSSIDNLWDVQTFLFKGPSSEVVKVPDSFWNMTKLRHVSINDGASFDIEPHRLENSSSLPVNLQTFSTPSLTYGDNMEKILRRIGGIRKLKCIFLDSWDDAQECNKFPLLEFLDKLESLKVIYNGMMKYPYVFSFPKNITKLTLSNFHMPWNQISQLADACENLEILKLVNNACDGESWDMEEAVVFPKLRFLKLDTLNVVTWNATCDNFPELMHLILHKCVNLEEIPSDFIYIDALEVIEVMWCKRSAATSAKDIEIEKHGYKGNDIFKVDIFPKLLDHELPSL